MTLDPGLPLWEQRFRAAQVAFPRWARRAPDRLVLASSESGAWQVWAWDRATTRRVQVTDSPVGVIDGYITPDGEQVLWFDDRTGDEVGIWMAVGFPDGSRGSPRPYLPGVPEAWSAGLALGDGVTVAGTASQSDGFTVWMARGGDGDEAKAVHRHPEYLMVQHLSRDSALVVFEHAEHGAITHRALRVLDVDGGGVVGELWDGPGFGLHAAAWSPVIGDPRLAFNHERTGTMRPGVWDIASGSRLDLHLDLPGEVRVLGWWPDGTALLLVHGHEGRDRLLRFDLAAEEPITIEHPPGTVADAGVRPDGEVWLLHSSGATPPALMDHDGEVLLDPEGPTSPPGYPYRSWHFSNPHGQQVHGWLVLPEGPPPYPLVHLVHGGPHWLWADAWRPDVAAWVDHGCAVAMVNYRGSTGYGPEWRDAIIGAPGFTELEDLMAGLDDVAGSGLADAGRVVLTGGSWGGYLTLLGMGRHPDRFTAGIAVVPVADYVAAYEDEAPALQSLDETLFGGSPDSEAELYVERSPITYVDRVAAPVLIIAGDNDTRCPIRQVENYVARLQALGVEHELRRYDAGHGAMVLDERVRHMRWELEFALPRLGLPPA